MENEIIEVPMEVELLDTTIEKIQAAGYVAVPFTEISSYGLVGNELIKMVDSIRTPGGEGIYRVTFPKGASGTLSKFKDENAFFGAIRADKGFSGQARLTQLSFNPEQVFMAIALMDISIKLQEILETQKIMLEFLYAKEEAKIYGNFSMLNEAIQNYRYNWDQEKYIDQNIGLVRNIKNDMYKSIDLSKRQIQDILATPDDLHFVKSAGKKVQRLVRLIRNYHDAQYLLSYATFFETLLLKNFREENLDNIRNTLIAHANEYRALYQKSSSWAEHYITSSVNYKVAPVLFATDKMFEKGLKKIPIGLDKPYGAESELYRPVEEQVAPFGRYKETGTSVFAEEVKKINTINNCEVDMYIDGDNVYLLEDASNEKGE